LGADIVGIAGADIAGIAGVLVTTGGGGGGVAITTGGVGAIGGAPGGMDVTGGGGTSTAPGGMNVTTGVGTTTAADGMEATDEGSAVEGDTADDVTVSVADATGADCAGIGGRTNSKTGSTGSIISCGGSGCGSGSWR